jgi:hypothetical protein
MQYKDLIYKITSSNKTPTKTVDSQEMKKPEIAINAAKKSVQIKDILIGVMIGDETVLNKGISKALQREVERTLTVLFNSPISDTFSFLPYDKTTLISMLELFPDRNHHFISGREDFNEVKEMKKNKLNLTVVHASLNTNVDFVNKIDYLVTVNIDEIESSMKSKLDEKNVMVFPLTFRGTEQFSQKEKLVVPDPNGWGYNPASGMWAKYWGNDGSAEIPSWKAPDDWNLDPEPK